MRATALSEMSRSRFQNLPNELKDDIVQLLVREDQKSLRLACKSFDRIVRPVLFRSIHINITMSYGSLHKRLAPRVSKHIRHLNVTGGGYESLDKFRLIVVSIPKNKLWSFEADLLQGFSQPSHIATLFTLQQDLQHLALNFNATNFLGSRGMLATAAKNMHKLRSLYLKADFPKSNDQAAIWDTLITGIPQLEHLYINAHPWGAMGSLNRILSVFLTSKMATPIRLTTLTLDGVDMDLIKTQLIAAMDFKSIKSLCITRCKAESQLLGLLVGNVNSLTDFVCLGLEDNGGRDAPLIGVMNKFLLSFKGLRRLYFHTTTGYDLIPIDSIIHHSDSLEDLVVCSARGTRYDPGVYSAADVALLVKCKLLRSLGIALPRIGIGKRVPGDGLSTMRAGSVGILEHWDNVLNFLRCEMPSLRTIRFLNMPKVSRHWDITTYRRLNDPANHDHNLCQSLQQEFEQLKAQWVLEYVLPRLRDSHSALTRLAFGFKGDDTQILIMYGGSMGPAGHCVTPARLNSFHLWSDFQTKQIMVEFSEEKNVSKVPSRELMRNLEHWF